MVDLTDPLAGLSGLLPALAWLLASFILSMGNSQGSIIIITATPAGEQYLHGGTLAAAAGVAVTFARWASRAARPR